MFRTIEAVGGVIILRQLEIPADPSKLLVEAPVTDESGSHVIYGEVISAGKEALEAGIRSGTHVLINIYGKPQKVSVNGEDFIWDYLTNVLAMVTS